ncbi:MAG: hypothetical protein QW797_09545 [Thermoproteota archaeon]
MLKKSFTPLSLSIFLIFLSLIIRPAYASPPWLTVGFYARYNVKFAFFQPITSLENPYAPQSSYSANFGNGSFVWKVEKIENNVVLMKINFSIVGIVVDSMEKEVPLWSEVEFSRSFHILVDVNSRFILNASSVSPLYFPYWIPIGTKEGEELFIGHQKLENFWLIGKFYLCGADIDTGLKKFHGSDILFMTTHNRTEDTGRFLPLFDAFYDRESGLLIALVGTEPLSLKFLDTRIIVRPIEMVLDRFGIEPVSNAVDNNPSTMPSISISGIVAPSEIEVGKEFELNLILFNNGTVNTGNLVVLLSSLNGNFITLSGREVLVENINPLENREVKWRLMLHSEGECRLRLSILKDSIMLSQKDLVIKGRRPRFGGVELLMTISIILILVLALLVALLKRRRKRDV